MCFNKETSLTVFIFSFSLSNYILYRGMKNKNKIDIIFASLIIPVSLIQLNEYYIWKNQECGTKNSFWSIIICLILFLQIISFVIVSNLIKYKKTNVLENYLFLFFIILAIGTIYILNKNKDKICSKPTDKNCRLEWGSIKYLYNNNFILLLNLLAIYLYFMYKFISNTFVKNTMIIKNYYGMIGTIYALVVSFYLEKVNFFNIFGSIWCFIGAFSPLIYLLN